MDKFNPQNWEDIQIDFLIGMLGSLDEETKAHITRCKTCNDKIAPLLMEVYRVMITDNKELHKLMNQIVLTLGTHMGLDPKKFKEYPDA